MKKFVKVAIIAAIVVACRAIGTGEEEEVEATVDED